MMATNGMQPSKLEEEPNLRDASTRQENPAPHQEMYHLERPHFNWGSLNNKLYNRSSEEKELFDAFNNIMKPRGNKAPELILITGSAGMGKTALANSLRSRVADKAGFFISGKFEKFGISQSYYPFVRAFSSFAYQLNQRDEETKKQMRQALKHLTGTARILTDLIPALRSMFESEDSASGGQGAHAHKRLVYLFRSFLRSICRVDQPVVLLIDDLQWADPASLDLLAELLYDDEMEGLLILAACRGNEVTTDQHLSVILRELESNNVRIQEVKVRPLESLSIQLMLEDALQINSNLSSEDLSTFVWEETDGNPFAVKQFLRLLADEDFLRLVAEDGDQKVELRVSETKTFIKDNLRCDNAVQMLCVKIERLPQHIQNVLMAASCFGFRFDARLLSKIAGNDVTATLLLARDKGFVVRDDEGLEEYSYWRFVHDQIRESAYYLIPNSQRESTHLKFGRKLLSGLNPDELSAYSFAVVDQFTVAAHLVETQDERERVASLFLHAGEKAASSSAFVTAAEHLNLAIRLLGPNHWRDKYELSLCLYNAAAEVEYCNAKFGHMDNLIREILENAHSFNDRVRALTLSIYSLGTRNDLDGAIELGLQAVSDLGYPVVGRPGVLLVLYEVFKMKKLLGRYSDRDIMGLPMMQHADQLAAVRLMNIMYGYAINSRPMLAILISTRLTQLTISHGISSMSCMGFAMAGMLLCTGLGDVVLGLGLATLSVALMDRFEAREWTARVYPAVYGFCFSLQNPLHHHLPRLLYSHRVGMGTGDIEFAMMSASMYAGLSIFSSRHLKELTTDLTNFLEIMKIHKQTNMLQFMRPLAQYCLNLTGQSIDPCKMDGTVMREAEAYEEASGNHTVNDLINVMKLMLFSYFQRYRNAEEVALVLARSRIHGLPCFNRASLFLHQGIAAFHMSWQGRAMRRVRFGKKCIRNLKNLVNVSPTNYTSKMELLEAELWLAQAKPLENALKKFNDSAEHARELGLLNEIGLAYERAAMALKRVERHRDSYNYIGKAIAAYDEWGATAKVDSLKRQYTTQSAP